MGNITLALQAELSKLIEADSMKEITNVMRKGALSIYNTASRLQACKRYRKEGRSQSYPRRQYPAADTLTVLSFLENALPTHLIPAK